jgi:glycine dehydrogenase subunit 1
LSAPHPFLPNLDEALTSEMLKRIGASSVDELFSDIPQGVRLRRRLRIAEAQSEYTVRRGIASRLASNSTPPHSLCFLGGGVWPHYIPAAVESITARQEFYTSYTPYQAEASQGMLQSLFEYQSLMCDLLGMEVCNSSLYDWASAAGEAARMAARVTGRRRLLVAGNAGPRRLGVLNTYVEPLGLEVEKIPFDKTTGRLDAEAARRSLSTGVAGLYLENPNYFGVLEEEAGDLISAVHSAGGLAMVGVDPISLSLVKAPGGYGADIVVGEGQPLGIPMNYGGPHLGIFAVKDTKLARTMPGRLIGMTTTVADPNQKAFAMVLQTREQHIRREAATSNVCTNQALMGLAAAAYLSLLGKSGFRRLGEAIVSNSHYAARRLSKIKGVVSPRFSGAFFKEFAVEYPRGTSAAVQRKLTRKKILAGHPLEPEFGLGHRIGLFCVTEVHDSDDIESLAVALQGAVLA